MTKTFLDVLDKIETTTGTNDKLALLEANKDNIDLMDFLNFGLDDRITFGVANIKPLEFTEEDRMLAGKTIFEVFKELCYQLIHRKETGNSAHRSINHFLSRCSVQEHKWYKKCIEKDLSSLRVGASLVNRVWDHLCLDFECMLAEKEEKIVKINFSKGATVELKGNGIRTLWHIGAEGKVTPWVWYPSYSGPVGRSGMPLPQFMFLKEYIEGLSLCNVVVDSEVHANHVLANIQTLMQYEEKNISDFTNSKGVVSKSWEKEVIKARTVAEIRNITTINVIDVLTMNEWYTRTCTRIYSDRRAYLNKYIDEAAKERGLNHKIQSMPYVSVDSYEAASVAAKVWINQKLEGAIVKQNDGLYRWTRHHDWTKIKEEVEADVVILGVIEAKQTFDTSGKPEPKMTGKFLVTDGTRTFEVGTGKGWTRKFYQDSWNNKEDYIGKVMKITAQCFTSKAAICPRFDYFRDDKTKKDILG